MPWFEGLLDLFDASLGQGNKERRAIGYAVGRQVIGVYILELILKGALNKLGTPYERIHNLLQLYSKLPCASKEAAERKYAQILADEVERTWDVTRTVESFLDYLGSDPFNDTRYFWERHRSSGRSIVFLPPSLRHLIYALFIALHNYPEGFEPEARYRTQFDSLEDSFKEADRRRGGEQMPESGIRIGKRIRPVIYWLEGLIAYFLIPVQREPDDLRILGFYLGQRIIGLYSIEMLLKYALDNGGRFFGRNHALYSLFARLPRPSRLSAERAYQELLKMAEHRPVLNSNGLGEHLRELGNDPITDLRYFWEGRNTGIPLSPNSLVPVVFALLIALHDYPVQYVPK